jgi:hypothetical protein
VIVGLSAAKARADKLASSGSRVNAPVVTAARVVRLRPPAGQLGRCVRLIGPAVLGQFDRIDLGRQQRRLPGIHADAIAGQVAAGAKLTRRVILDDDDHLVVDRSRGLRVRLPGFPYTPGALASCDLMTGASKVPLIARYRSPRQAL